MLCNIMHISPKSGYHKNNNGTDGTAKNVHAVLLDSKYLHRFFTCMHTATLVQIPSTVPRIKKYETQTTV